MLKAFIDIRDRIADIDARVTKNPRAVLWDPRIILVGIVRSGKDALALYLAGHELQAESSEDGLLVTWNLSPIVEPDKEKCDLRIIDGAVGSGLGSCQVQGQVLWSCPGNCGIESPLEDLSNVASIRKLFDLRRVCKLILVVGFSDIADHMRLQTFADSLSDFRAIHGDAAMNAAILVISKVPGQSEDQVLRHLRGLVMNTLREHADAFGTAPDFLAHLLARDRICIFPAPADPGPYPEKYRDSILKRLESFSYVDGGLNRAVDLTAGTMHYLVGLRDQLAADVTSFLKTSLRQAIIEYAKSMCRGNTTSAADLRDRLDAFGAVPLEGLDRVTWLADQLNEKLESREYDFIPSHYEAICFLEAQFGVCANTSMVDGWVLAATTGFRVVSGLKSSPMFVTTKDMVIVCGFIVALSDISKYLSDHPDISLNRFLVMAANNFILDCNITLRGGLLAVFAPTWSCITADAGPITVNLTGEDRDEQDPDYGYGLPGWPGGKFIGRGCRFNNMKGNLVVLTHGGRGAAGRNGEPGLPGKDGGDATVPKGGYRNNCIKLKSDMYVDLLWVTEENPRETDYIILNMIGDGSKLDYETHNRHCSSVKGVNETGRVQLGPNKCLRAVKGRRGDVIDRIIFEVYDLGDNKAEELTFGGSGGAHDYDFRKDNSEIICFKNIHIRDYSHGRNNYFPIVQRFEVEFRLRESNDQTMGKPGSQGEDGRAGGYGGLAGFAGIRGKISHF